MNNLPKIIIKDGYGIDESGNLNSVTMSDNVDTVTTPTSVTTYATTVNWIPSNSSTLTVFNAPNIGNTIPNFTGYTSLRNVTLGSTSLSFSHTTSSTGMFYGCSALTVNLPYVTSLSTSNNNAGVRNGGIFYNSGLTSINVPNLISVSDYANGYSVGTFYGCPLTTFSAPKLTTINCGIGYVTGVKGPFSQCTSLITLDIPKIKNITSNSVITATTGAGAFYGCSALTSINFPEISTIGTCAFGKCTALKSIILGSYQNPVTSIGADAFYDVTASDITVKIWTSDGNALANAPFGLTGADIAYYNSNYPEEEQNDN